MEGDVRCTGEEDTSGGESLDNAYFEVELASFVRHIAF